MEIASRYGLSVPASTKFSKASSLKDLPSFVGDFDSDEDVRRVPMQYNPSHNPSLTMLDMENLQALLSTLVKVSFPLMDVLKVRPKLW